MLIYFFIKPQTLFSLLNGHKPKQNLTLISDVCILKNLGLISTYYSHTQKTASVTDVSRWRMIQSKNKVDNLNVLLACSKEIT